MDATEPAPTAADAPQFLTLAEWADQCGYTYNRASELAQKKDFPDPEPDRYRQVPKKRKATLLPAGIDPEHTVTLTEFASLIGVSAQTLKRALAAHTQPPPAAVEASDRPARERRRVRELVQWWNARPATTTRVRVFAADKLAPFGPQGHPPLRSALSLGVDPAEEVTLSRFATIIGEDRGNVGQYRRLSPETMPHTADGRRVQDLAKGEQATFVFEELRRWWSSRPGSRAGYRADRTKGRKRGPRVEKPTPQEASGVTLSGFAQQVGVSPAKVHRRRERFAAQMPTTVDGRRPEALAKGEHARFDPEELLRWWRALPADETLR